MPGVEPDWLPRVLKPVTEVRVGEAVTALLLTLNTFLLLAAYYLIKPVREALIVWERRRMQAAPPAPPKPAPPSKPWGEVANCRP